MGKVWKKHIRTWNLLSSLLLVVQDKIELLVFELFRLTIAGIVVKIKGNLRPKAFVINPKKILPMKPPKLKSDATQEASSMVILPDGSGVSSDVSRIILGEGHPTVTPYPIKSRLTGRKLRFPLE